ncbi:hypothetical protein FHS78_003714 [Parvibaculum indicum]|nr:hypothetical protein [Parvibaculum indicum]
MASGRVGMKLLRDIALSCVLIAALLVSGGAIEPAHADTGPHHDAMEGPVHTDDAVAIDATEDCEVSTGIPTDRDSAPVHCCHSVVCTTGFVFEPILGLSAIRASLLLTVRPRSYSSRDLWKGTPPWQPPRSFV